MFERYTEFARRTIFFARYEASVYGSLSIEPEHLLLGILREDKLLSGKLPMERARKAIDSHVKRGERVSTSVDLPLNDEAKRVLHYAAEEATVLNDVQIDTMHLALGLLRVESSFAAEILNGSGLESATLRTLRRAPPPPPPPPAVEAPALAEIVQRYLRLEERATQYLEASSETDARKEALGHLIDLATAHHQWFVRALIDPKVTAAGYPDQDWIRVQNYAAHPWTDLVEAWSALNTLLIHVLSHVPENKLETPCRIGIADPIPLAQLIHNYVDQCTSLLAGILSRG